jgi:hypothetical protein
MDEEPTLADLTRRDREQIRQLIARSHRLIEASQALLTRLVHLLERVEPTSS